jgi:hypothetical protein
MFAIDHYVLPGANEVSGDVMVSGQNQICSLHSTIYCCSNQFSFVVGFVFSSSAMLGFLYFHVC